MHSVLFFFLFVLFAINLLLLQYICLHQILVMDSGQKKMWEILKRKLKFSLLLNLISCFALCYKKRSDWMLYNISVLMKISQIAEFIVLKDSKLFFYFSTFLYPWKFLLGKDYDKNEHLSFFGTILAFFSGER